MFPRGVPEIPVVDYPFLLEENVEHILQTAQRSPHPYISYYHLYPPHQPYNTRAEYTNLFRKDGVTRAAEKDRKRSIFC